MELRRCMVDLTQYKINLSRDDKGVGHEGRLLQEQEGWKKQNVTDIFSSLLLSIFIESN